jgi:hypothetical protein
MTFVVFAPADIKQIPNEKQTKNKQKQTKTKKQKQSQHGQSRSGYELVCGVRHE